MPKSLRSYPPTWEGTLPPGCRKWQKKLKGEPGMRAPTKLKKTIKRLNKEHPGAGLHLMSVPCMDMCPKGAVTMSSRDPAGGELSILPKEDEIDGLYRHN